jgi:hypothetical protein
MNTSKSNVVMSAASNMSENKYANLPNSRVGNVQAQSTTSMSMKLGGNSNFMGTPATQPRAAVKMFAASNDVPVVTGDTNIEPREHH